MSQPNSLRDALNERWTKGVADTPHNAFEELLKLQYVRTMNSMFRHMSDTWIDKSFDQLHSRTVGKNFSFENFCQQVRAHGAHVSTET